MAAFLPTPVPIPLYVQGFRSTSLRPAFRPRPFRSHAARIHVSATTDEVRAPDNLSRTADQNGIPSTPDDAVSKTNADNAPKLNAPPSLTPPPSRPSDKPPRFPQRGQGRANAFPGTGAGAASSESGEAGAGGADAATAKVLYTRCGNCSAVYPLDPKTLGRGRKVKCSVCENTWFQRADRLMVLNPERETMSDYPLEQKEELIKKAAEFRRNRPPRAPRDFPPGDRRGGPRGDWNRDGGRPGGERFSRGGERPGGGERRGRGGGRTGFSVFIGNLPYTVTEEQLREAVQSVMPDGRLTLMKDMETGRSRGFAFCDCKSDEHVEEAVAKLDGIEVGGRTIQVRPGRKSNSR